MSLAFRLRDWTDRSPPGYVMRPRRLGDIRAAILHQTSFEWREGNPMWAKVRAHFVVHRSGLVTHLHPVTARMRFGAGHANAWAVNIECEGNLPLDYDDGEPLYWRPEKYGRSVITAEQVEAARGLLTWLKGQIRGLQIGTHRQVDEGKSGCCGPDIWREVGQYAIDTLDMAEMSVDGGRPIPDEWRGPVLPSLRTYTGPLGVEVSP